MSNLHKKLQIYYQHFTSSVLADILFAKKLQAQNVTLENFLPKKVACKMLVKITSGLFRLNLIYLH